MCGRDIETYLSQSLRYTFTVPLTIYEKDVPSEVCRVHAGTHLLDCPGSRLVAESEVELGALSILTLDPEFATH